jgi:hypothetical protein
MAPPLTASKAKTAALADVAKAAYASVVGLPFPMPQGWQSRGGHTATQGPLPTVAGNLAMDAGPAMLANSTDIAGSITFTPTGAVAAGTVICTMTFALPFQNTPIVVCSEARGQGAVINPYYEGSSKTIAQFVAGQGGLLAHTQYRINYTVTGLVA